MLDLIVAQTELGSDPAFPAQSAVAVSCSAGYLLAPKIKATPLTNNQFSKKKNPHKQPKKQTKLDGALHASSPLQLQTRRIGENICRLKEDTHAF